MTDICIVAKYDYTAQDPQELSLRKNERLRLLDDTKNWWKATNEQGQTGFVPSNYVRKESLMDKAKGTFKGFGALNSNGMKSRPRLGDSNNDQHEQDTNGVDKYLNGMSTSSPTVESAIAKFDYQPQRDDELALQKGQAVRVLEKSSDGWWKGEVSMEKGWFPSNYVDTCSTPSAIYPADYNGGFADTTVTASIDENSSNLAQLSNGLRGYPSAAQSSSPSLAAKVYEIVVALYSFDAQTAEEMTFRKGEKLDIIDHPTHDPEWWLARNAQGQQGLVPTNYIEIVDHNPVGSAFANGVSSASSRTAPPSSNTFQQRQKAQLYSQNNTSLTGPYASQPWFYGRLTRDQADTELSLRGSEGDFLIRESESNPGDYSISVKDKVRNKHFWVQLDNRDGSFKIGNRSFKSMEALITHYMQSPIFSNEKTKDNLYLVRPLPK